MSIPEQSIVQFNLVFQQQGQKWINTHFYNNVDEIQDDDELANLQQIFTLIQVAGADAQHDSVQCIGAVVSLPTFPSFGTRTLTSNILFGTA